MDKVPGSPFNSAPPSSIPPNNSASQNLPKPNDIEMTQASTSGIKRKVQQISPDEGGINPQFVKTQLLKREGNRAEYKKGISYVGDFVDGIPNGKGILRFKDVRTYEGNMKNGFPHGLGKVTYFDGTYYEGTFQNGLPQGSGVLKLPTGNKLETVFKDGVFKKGNTKIAFKKDGSFYYGPCENRKGKGIQITRKGLKYSGSIVNELFHGDVTIHKKNELFFEGQFINGIPIKGKISKEDSVYIGEVDEYFECVGKGRYVNKTNDSVLEGEFLENGDFYGVVTDSRGIRSKGLFKNWEEPIGVLEITYPSGNVYIGTVSEGFPHGEGALTLTDGTFFRGQFVKGQIVEGVINYPDGSVYTGTVKDFHMHGFGKFQNGNSIYEGEFFNDVFQGYGVATFPNGSVYEGLWLDGRPFINFQNPNPERSFDWTESGNLKTNQYESLNESKTGKGKIIYPNGSIYIGSIVEGLANGEGVLVSPQGEIYRGSFFEGKIFGKGKIEFKNYSYEGDFVEGRYSGQGKEIEKYAKDEIAFEGNYLDGMRHGDGVVSFLNGLKMTVQFNESTPIAAERTFFIGDLTGTIAQEPKTIQVNETQDLIVFPSGIYLIANKEGGKIKEGILHYTNGNTYKGQFENANKIPPSYFPEGNGTMTYKGFGVFTGKFKNGQPDIHPDYLVTFHSDQSDFFKPKKLS